MIPPNEPDISPFGVLAALATVLVGPQLAPVVSAYALIFIGWSAGIIIGVYRSPPTTRARVLGFMAVSFVVTFGIAVPTAQWLADFMPSVQAKALLFPVAVALPAIGSNWGDLISWALERAKKRILGERE